MGSVLPQREAARGKFPQREAGGCDSTAKAPRGRRGEKGLPISPKIGRLRLDDAAKDLVTDYKVNARRALEHVKRRIDKALLPYFGGWRMANITTADVRAYIDRRQQDGAANATINRELAALKRAFTLAIQAGKLLQRPHIPMLQ